MSGANTEEMCDGGNGTRPLFNAIMRSIPGSAQNHDGGTLPRTGSSKIMKYSLLRYSLLVKGEVLALTALIY